MTISDGLLEAVAAGLQGLCNQAYRTLAVVKGLCTLGPAGNPSAGFC